MMNKLFFTVLAIIVSYQFAAAQKASDVIENGTPVKSGEKIFLQYNNNVIKFDITRSLQDVSNPPDFITLGDSSIFLVSRNGVNIYLLPLNPLNFSYNTETKVITDPINEAASAGLATIVDVISTTAKKVNTPGPQGASTTTFDTCQNFNNIESSLKLIQERLKNNQKDAIIKIFKSLQELSFIDELATTSNLDKYEKQKTIIEQYFNKTDSLIELTKQKVGNYNCDKTSGFITKYIFNSILKDLSETAQEQEKRLGNLQTAFKSVRKMQETAAIGGAAVGLRWCLKLDEVPSNEGKISIYTISIKKNGYELSEKNEIINVGPKDILKRTIRVRKFQRFVPEVAVGTAFTFFKYNSYGTTSDSTGKQYVAPPTENSVRNINITTMLNFNYYMPDSPIHFLYQIGAGINSGIPTIITGFGIRSNINGIKRISLSGGIAMTWIKELDKLKVGSQVTGTNDIDKDLKFQFSWPPKPYIGLQYNF